MSATRTCLSRTTPLVLACEWVLSWRPAVLHRLEVLTKSGYVIAPLLLDTNSLAALRLLARASSVGRKASASALAGTVAMMVRFSGRCVSAPGVLMEPETDSAGGQRNLHGLQEGPLQHVRQPSHHGDNQVWRM